MFSKPRRNETSLSKPYSLPLIFKIPLNSETYNDIDDVDADDADDDVDNDE